MQLERGAAAAEAGSEHVVGVTSELVDLPARDVDRALAATLRALVGSIDGGDAGWEGFVATTAAVAAGVIDDCECTLALTPDDGRRVLDVIAAAGPAAEGMAVRWELAGSPFAGRLDTDAAYDVGIGGFAAWATTVGASAFSHARVMPVRAGAATGALVFWRHGEAAFSAADCEVMDVHAELVRAAVRRGRQRRLLETSEQRHALIAETALDLGATLDPRAITRRLLERAVGVLDADAGSVGRVRDDSMLIEHSHYRSDRPSSEGMRFPLDISLAFMRTAVETMRPTVSREPIDPEVVPERIRDYVAGDRDHLAVPMPIREGDVALLILARSNGRPFDDGDVRTAQLIANVAALALRNGELYADAQAAARAKAEFLSLAGHELRTPLTVVAGYLSMLRDGTFGPPSPSWLPALDTVAAKTAELGELVDELLLAARLEHGAVDLEIGTHDLRDIVAAVALRLEPRARLLSGTIDVSASGEAVEVRCDRRQTERIVANLIHNALSYAVVPPHVRVSVRGGAQPAVAVEDNGIGVPDDRRETLFDAFVRVPDSRLISVSGTGLGLFIARQLARAQGGDVVLEESVPDAGSRFALVLTRGATAATTVLTLP